MSAAIRAHYLFQRNVHYIINDGEIIIVEASQSILVQKGARVRYSNPFDEPCEYIAICKPAFDFTKVHREEN